jgi:hypothetical protein
MLNELELALATSRAVDSGVRPHVAVDDLPESLRLAERRTWLLGGLLAASLLTVAALGFAVWGQPFKRWSAAAGASAALTSIPDRSGDSRVTTASQPGAPTVAPTATSGSGLENSVSIAAPNMSSVAPEVSAKEVVMPAAASAHPLRPQGPSPVAAKKVTPKTTPTSPLERRGNERYGRFD